MVTRYFILSAFGIITLAGCQTTQPVHTVDLAPLSAQIENLSTANADLKVANERLTVANADLLTANEQLKATLRADADAGLAANAKGWLPFEKYVWGHQIQLLPVGPDEETSAKWLEASTLYSAGGESAMQGVVNDLTEQAGQLNTKLGELSKAAETAQIERDTAQKAAGEAMQRAQKAEGDLADAVAKAKADKDGEFAEKVRAWQVNAANWFGGGLFAAALACVAAAFLLPVSSKMLKEAAAMAFALCVGCFAFARFLGWPLFLPVVGGAYLVAGAGWFAWKVRSGMREAAAKKAAATNDLAVKPIISTLDTAYDAADADHQAWMDVQIFEQLGKQGAQYSAAIHEIKASIALAKSDTAL